MGITRDRLLGLRFDYQTLLDASPFFHSIHCDLNFPPTSLLHNTIEEYYCHTTESVDVNNTGVSFVHKCCLFDTAPY